MESSLDLLREVIADGKRIRAKHPEFKNCKILKLIEELEEELEIYQDIK